MKITNYARCLQHVPPDPVLKTCPVCFGSIPNKRWRPPAPRCTPIVLHVQEDSTEREPLPSEE